MKKIVCVLLFLSTTGFAMSEPLTLWISSLRDKAYYERMVERYRAYENPQFEANIEALGFREMPDKLSIVLRANEGVPDLIQLDEVFFGMFLHGEPPFLDLTDRLEAANFHRSLLPSRMSLFAYGGKTYGLPQSVSSSLLYYRRDLLESHGITTDDLSTWQSLREVGERLAEKGQSTIAVDPSYFEVILRQRGSDLFGESGEVLPDFEAAVETLDWLANLVRDGVGQEPDRGTIYDPVFFSGDIANGEVLMVAGAEWYGIDFLEQFSKGLTGKWGVLPLPVWDDGGESEGESVRTSTFSGQGLLIPKASERQEEAWGFMKFVISDYQANLDRFLSGNSFPAFKPVFSDPRLLKPSDFYGGDSLGRLVVDLSSQVPPIVTDPRRPQAVFLIREGLLTAVVNDVMDARSALIGFKDRLEEGVSAAR